MLNRIVSYRIVHTHTTCLHQNIRSESSLNSLTLDEVLMGGGGGGAATTATTTKTNSTSSDSTDSIDKQKINNAVKQDKDNETAKAMAKAGFVAGFMMLLGPMVSKIRGLFAKNNNDTDVSLPHQQQQHSTNAQTTTPKQQLMPEQATRSATNNSNNYYNASHQMSQSIAHESSRHLACGVYYSADPVKQAVLQQAMISAAQSAGASAAQGAAVLAGTTAAAGMAVGTKLVIAGIILSFLLGGGLVVIAATDKEDEKIGGSGDGVGVGGAGSSDSNGNGGGAGGDNIVSSLCPLGEVLSLEDNLCIPSLSICEPWQQAINGECTKCPDGTVSVVDGEGGATHVECEPCPPGTVRSDSTGKGEGLCMPAENFCEPWQQAIDGKCTECPAGQVAVETYDACEVCPAGTVRSNMDGTGLGPCVLASNYCEPWQGATDGKCTDCPVGAVSEIDEATGLPTFERCSFCDPGNVRVQADGVPLGSCVSAVGFCKEYQAARNGKCVDCGPGEAPSVNTDGTPNHEECIFCPRGQVRSSANGLALGPCVPAQGLCQEWEMAAFGRCNTCALGQVSTRVDGQFTHIDCEFCPRGQVRGSEDGRGEGPCISAVGVCQPNQRATKGQCISCINGLLSSVDANGNYNHMSCV